MHCTIRIHCSRLQYTRTLVDRGKEGSQIQNMISRILTIWLLVQESHAFSPHLLHRANGQGHRIQRVGQGLHAEPVSVNGSTSNSSESVSVVASNSKTIDKISTLMNTATATATNNLDAKASEITITSNNGTNNLAEDILAQVNTLESTFVSSPPLSFEKYLTMQVGPTTPA